MQETVLWAASAVMLTTFLTHTFIGGMHAARPLLADNGLPRASKWLNYYCWHVTTLTILGLTGAFVYTAVRPDRPELAVLATTLSASFALLSAAVAIKGGLHPLRFPSTSLFTVTAVLGTAALILRH
jgi:hypothetical protein